MPAHVLHISQGLSGGGAGRAMLALTRYLGPEYVHTSLSIAPSKTGPEGQILASEHGVRCVVSSDMHEIQQCISAADIVHVHWWNNPELDQLLSLDLPAARYVGWFHVGGHESPQLVSDECIDFFDVAVACSPHTFSCPAFLRARASRPSTEVRMIYGATDFARVRGVSRLPHQGFNIGYIGTVEFLKMHRDFVKLSSAVRIPEARFVVCGSGGAIDTLRAEAQACGMETRMEFKGYVDDLSPILSTLDAYGYPLCPDNYSGSELNLQEVMYLGIPPVVFSHGGVGKLVVNNYSGYVVESAAEYAGALEFLFHNPEERARLGSNAKSYAAQLFGAEHAARAFRDVYAHVLQKPKRARQMSMSQESLVREILGKESSEKYPGTVRMVASLGEQSQVFLASAAGATTSLKVEADEMIRRSSPLLRDSALLQYSNYYQNEPILRLWLGLAFMGSNRYQEAYACFSQVWNQGFQEKRVLWYITEASALANNPGLVL